METNNIYVGNRYIPIVGGEWSSTTDYEALVIVQYQDAAYISRRPVPAGTPISDDNYWAFWGSGNGLIDTLQKQINEVYEAITRLESSIPWYSSLFAGLVGDGTTDNTIIFNGLPENQPVALMPGDYLITGDIVIKPYIQFLPGARIIMHDSDPYVYYKVTFEKDFLAYNSQIFKYHIQPRIKYSATPFDCKFSWFGGHPDNIDSENDEIINYMLSPQCFSNGVVNIEFDNATYYFSNMSRDQVNNIHIYGKNTVFRSTQGNLTIPRGLYENCYFPSILQVDTVEMKECQLDTTGGIYAINATFDNCIFNINGFNNNLGVRSAGSIFNRCRFNSNGAASSASMIYSLGTTVIDKMSSDNTEWLYKLDSAQFSSTVVKNSIIGRAKIRCAGNLTMDNCELSVSAEQTEVFTAPTMGDCSLTMNECQISFVNVTGTYIYFITNNSTARVLLNSVRFAAEPTQVNMNSTNKHTYIACTMPSAFLEAGCIIGTTIGSVRETSKEFICINSYIDNIFRDWQRGGAAG